MPRSNCRVPRSSAFASSSRPKRGELDLAGGSEHLRDRAAWRAFVDALFETDWVVYAKPAFGGATAVLRYLGRYTHRVAISNHRLLAFDGDHVTFSYKDYAHGDQRRTMTLTAMEFLRRFVQHILPRGFVRIRPVGIPREHGPGRPRDPRAGLARHIAHVGCGDRCGSAAGDGGTNPRHMGLSTMRCRDDRRDHPLGAPTRHRSLRLRHLVTARRSSNDWRPHRRGDPRVRSRVSRTQKPAPDHGLRLARSRDPAPAAAARASPAIQSIVVHARRS
jgi:hypothetical protein